MTEITSRPIAARPFLKWAGGKAQLLPEIIALLEPKFSACNSWTYIEPFVGGGAVLFGILERFKNVDRVVINDINPHLVAAYTTLRNEPELVIDALSKIEREYLDLEGQEAKKCFYFARREEFNQLNGKTETLAKTVLFIFLNKTCFNGLHRVNSKGEFNVPFGQRPRPKICDRDNLWRVSQCLQKVKIEEGDFYQTLNSVGENVLYYLDPPYKPLNSTSSFTAYTREDFGDRDQIRLKEFCDCIHQAGGNFIASNSDVSAGSTPSRFFEELYQNYTVGKVKAKRNINCKAEGRGAISELLITNLPTQNLGQSLNANPPVSLYR